MSQIGYLAGTEVIDADHGVALTQQAVCQVRAQKTGGAGNQNAHNF
jgi:hypothetical protein